MFKVSVKKVITIVLISLVFVMITIVFSSKIILSVNSEMLTTYEQNNMKLKKISDVILINNYIEIYYDKSSDIYNNLSKTLSGDDSKSTIDYLIDNKKKPKIYSKDEYKILEFNLNKSEIQKVFENINVDNDMIIRVVFDNENELGNEINFKLNILNNLINQRNQVTFIFFSKDKLKDGGCYKTIKGILKKYDEINKLIILEDKTKIYLDDIFSIKSPIFDNY